MAADRSLVTAIIIFLDAERFIEEAIESVFAQTYEHWELVLVDDGSGDRSTAIARDWALRFPDKVQYVEHPGHENRGMSAARNLGLRHARGEYVAFLDADDIFLPSKLEGQVALLTARPEVGMVCAPSLFWFFEPTSSLAHKRDFVQDLTVAAGTALRPPKLLIELLRNENIHPANCSILFRSRLCREVGGFEESFRGMYEDTVFLAKCLLSATVLIAEHCPCVYRVHHGSHCQQSIENSLYHPRDPNPARCALLRWLEGHLKREGIRDTALWRALRRELLPYEWWHFYLAVNKMRVTKRHLMGWGRRRLPKTFSALRTFRGQPAVAASLDAERGAVAAAFNELRNLYEANGRADEAGLAWAAACRAAGPALVASMPEAAARLARVPTR